MFMSTCFKSQVKAGEDFILSRKGEAKRFVIPNALMNRTGFDANIEGSDIVLSEGNSVYILTDKFGLGTTTGEVEAHLFFVDGGMVIELIAGKIILFDKHNDPYIVDEDGDIDYPDGKMRIRVLSVNEVREKASMIIKNRYGLNDNHDVDGYTDNLLSHIIMSYTAVSVEPCLNFRVLDLYEDIGLGKFNFVNYKLHKAFIEGEGNGIEHDDFDDPDDLDWDDEEEEDEYDMDAGDDDDIL